MFEKFAAQRDGADTSVFVLQPYGTVGRQCSPPLGQGVFHAFVAGLPSQAHAAEGRPPVSGQAFQIDDLRSQAGQFGQHGCFAAAGHAPEHQHRNGSGQAGPRPGPVRLVAPLQHVDRIASGFQQPGQRAAAHAAPPAMDEDIFAG